MLFSSEIFLFLFLPFVLFVYYGLLFRWRKLQNLFLLGMSLLFYAYGEPWFVLVMMSSIVVNWAFGLLVERFRKNRIATRGILMMMLVVNLGILGYFKYWMFFLGNINYFTGSYIPIPQITLPIGISFFTFQAISYVVDIYRGKGKAQKNPCNVGLYIAFFPQLIAGPIVRYETISEQIHGRRETLDDFSDGVCRFIVGLSKKMLLANTMALVADAAFEMAPTDRSVVMAWMGALAYTFQIYFDFSGYSDMAIGLGKMFGFHFLENFHYPYVSRSVSEFWRRWHMSLSSFFRDYVYIPLGGNRVPAGRLILNLFIVWALTGLWHGANWTFIGWGLFYFILLVFEKYTGFEKRGNSPFVLPLKHFYTILAFVLGWVLFRAENIHAAGAYFQTLFGLAGNPFFNDFVVFYFHDSRYFFLFALLFSTPVIPWLEKRWEGRACFESIRLVMYSVVFFISVVYVVKGGYNPFIYFNF
ncbi:MAG: MBOAT family O-acyltransferase [Planctomycetia bacterium]|nr:MBOAT family O-acyltransferase [Planctomycetia bacterium]